MFTSNKVKIKKRTIVLIRHEIDYLIRLYFEKEAFYPRLNLPPLLRDTIHEHFSWYSHFLSIDSIINHSEYHYYCYQSI